MSLRNDTLGSAEMRSVPELEDKAFEKEYLFRMLYPIGALGV